MRPFLYPKSLHKRTLSPAKRNNYRYYKPFLKDEFSSKCVYCLLPDGIKDPSFFGVDHYKPQSKFPSLETEYTNLFYACNACNRRKGNFWPSSQQAKRKEFIPNPCDHIMHSHLYYQGARVEPKTNAGKWTIDLLDLNNEFDLAYREFMLRTTNALNLSISKLKTTLKRLARKKAEASSDSERKELSLEEARQKHKLAELLDDMRRLGG